MKLTARLVGVGAAENMKELTILNPEATLNSLRAAIAINFRLPLQSFRMQHSSLNLADGKQKLREIGVQDGDTIMVVTKHAREEENEPQVQPSTHTAGLSGLTAAVNEASTAAEDGIETQGSSTSETEIEGEEEVWDDEDMDIEDGGPEELLRHLTTVPNLAEMRRRFLADPEGMTREISESDPQLLDLIARNHRFFSCLVGNENFVEQLQEGGALRRALTDEDGELDEEAEAVLHEVMSIFLSADGYQIDDFVDEESEDVTNETQRYLERVPTEEEEAKIEQLMQLGFTREQCKVAFFKSKRSIERAANLLFEDPPQL